MMTTYRFDDTKTAKQFAQAVRRRGINARRDGNEVTLPLPPAKAAQVLHTWALRRGALPNAHIVDYSK